MTDASGQRGTSGRRRRASEKKKKHRKKSRLQKGFGGKSEPGRRGRHEFGEGREEEAER